MWGILMELTAIDLFCGSGGFAYGMKKAGINIIRSIDFDPDVLEVHSRNMPRLRRGFAPFQGSRTESQFERGSIIRGDKPTRLADLKMLTDIAPELAQIKADIIFGGPPCGPFSKAGKQRGDNDAFAALTEAFAVIVAANRPKYFVMENVTGITKSAVFKRALGIFRNAGYAISEDVFDAADFGAAQRRKRCICAGALGDADGWLFDYINQYRKAPVSIADILGPDIGTTLYSSVDPTHGRAWSRGGIHADRDLAFKKGRGSSKAGYIRKADLALLQQSGEGRRFIWRYPGGKNSGCLVPVDQPHSTIISSTKTPFSKNYRPTREEPVDLRIIDRLTFEDLSLLSGFPANWVWSANQAKGKAASTTKGISHASLFQMLANSVLPPMAEAIGRAIGDHHKRKVLQPAKDATPFKITREYQTWLRQVKHLHGQPLTQEQSDLRNVKKLVAGRKLKSAEDELQAFDIMPTNLAPSRRSNLRRALSHLCEFEHIKSYVDCGMIAKSDLFKPDGWLDWYLASYYEPAEQEVRPPAIILGKNRKNSGSDANATDSRTVETADQ